MLRLSAWISIVEGNTMMIDAITAYGFVGTLFAACRMLWPASLDWDHSWRLDYAWCNCNLQLSQRVLTRCDYFIHMFFYNKIFELIVKGVFLLLWISNFLCVPTIDPLSLDLRDSTVWLKTYPIVVESIPLLPFSLRFCCTVFIIQN